MAHLYVAGKWEERTRIANLISLLRQRGHTVSHNWTFESDEGLEGEARAAYLQSCAMDDRRGAAECDTFVLVHNPKCRGAFVEMGIAIASGARVIILGWADKTEPVPVIFYFLPGVEHVATTVDLLDALDRAPVEAEAEAA